MLKNILSVYLDIKLCLQLNTCNYDIVYGRCVPCFKSLHLFNIRDDFIINLFSPISDCGMSLTINYSFIIPILSFEVSYWKEQIMKLITSAVQNNRKMIYVSYLSIIFTYHIPGVWYCWCFH